MEKIVKRKKAIVKTSQCVGCGCCVNVCPLSAISIYRGMYAMVNQEKCVGCGNCKKICPASVIEIEVEK